MGECMAQVPLQLPHPVPSIVEMAILLECTSHIAPSSPVPSIVVMTAGVPLWGRCGEDLDSDVGLARSVFMHMGLFHDNVGSIVVLVNMKVRMV